MTKIGTNSLKHFYFMIIILHSTSTETTENRIQVQQAKVLTFLAFKAS